MKFEKILVGLDFSFIDATVLAYVDFISDKLGFKAINFVHVAKDLEQNAQLKRKFDKEMESVEPWDEILLSKMKGSVEQVFQGNDNIEVSYHVLEGSPADQIIHWANVKNADLIVMGKKDVGSASGILAKKIARTSKHSMLFVTENAINRVNEIVIPVDFSDDSMEATKAANLIKSNSDECRLKLLHVYDVPAERFKVLHSFQQIQEMFEEGAREGFVQFRERMDFTLKDYSIDYVQDKFLNIAKQIYRYAKKEKPDLVVIGAKGHSKIELLIVGSVTENLLLLYDYSPILIVKLGR